jgi:hypothetical protein
MAKVGTYDVTTQASLQCQSKIARPTANIETGTWAPLFHQRLNFSDGKPPPPTIH